MIGLLWKQELKSNTKIVVLIFLFVILFFNWYIDFTGILALVAISIVLIYQDIKEKEVDVNKYDKDKLIDDIKNDRLYFTNEINTKLEIEYKKKLEDIKTINKRRIEGIRSIGNIYSKNYQILPKPSRRKGIRC